MKPRTLCTAVVAGFLCALMAVPLARADWNPGDGHKMHFPQLPDLSPQGLDVNATFWQVPAGQQPIFPFQKVLADDWTCSASGPVNDIHIWGSWLGDRKFPDTVFHLSIHDDIPKNPSNPNDYSKPGALLWEGFFSPTQYQQRVYATAQELVWDPNTGTIFGTDTLVWQYNFTNIPQPFVQQVGKTYWLDVQALVPAGPSPTAPEFLFGWKTSQDHYLDDAVFGDTNVFGGPPFPQFPDPNTAGTLIPWKDMHHPEFGYSLDMAFVITPEPASVGTLAIAIFGMGFLRRR